MSKRFFNLDTKNLINISYKKLLGNSIFQHHKNKLALVNHIFKLNPKKNVKQLFTKPYWNINLFNTKNTPVIIDNIEYKDKFSYKYNDKYHWILDLPIKMPGQPWAIPIELEQFSEFIIKSERFERLINNNIDNCYVYLCIDQRPVKPNESQRRPGWHSDSFITNKTHLDLDSKKVQTDSIYLCYDTIPTEFSEAIFEFPSSKNKKQFDYNDNQQVLKFFEDKAQYNNIITYPNYNILKIGPECIHRVGFNQTNTIINRTFAKLVFSTEIFNREGNDHNYLYDYNWYMIPRTNERNNSSLMAETINGISVNEYIEINPLLVRFDNDHIDDNYFIYHKKYKKINSVYAQPASPNEYLQTKINGYLTTTNYAKTSDWKIKTELGDEYLLSLDKLNEFYDYDNIKHKFVSKDNIIVDALLIKRPIKIKSPWLQIQYLDKGDYLVKRSSYDIYGVKKTNFNNSYIVLN